MVNQNIMMQYSHLFSDVIYMTHVREGSRFGYFIDGSIRSGRVKKIINGRKCMFVLDNTSDELEIYMKKLRKINPTVYSEV